MSRKSARETAFKTIFEIPFHEIETPSDIINYAVLSDESKISPSDRDYYVGVTTTCFEKIEDIDAKIIPSLKTWTIDRISKVNLSILRLALCEIMFMDDIPYQVSINEAVELAKKFGDDDAPSFINGVLGTACK